MSRVRFLRANEQGVPAVTDKLPAFSLIQTRSRSDDKAKSSAK